VYAIIEIIVAIGTIWLAIVTKAESLGVKCLALMGGIYILVRGLDNFEKTIDATGKFRDFWDTWLHGRDAEK
jgi:hypothetical protein